MFPFLKTKKILKVSDFNKRYEKFPKINLLDFYTLKNPQNLSFSSKNPTLIFFYFQFYFKQNKI